MTNTILIADDSTLTRRAILRELRAAPETRVVEARDGREALACIRSERPQLVFLDVAMPGLTGLEVLEALAAIPGDLSARVVVITSEEDPAVRDKARLLGACEVLPKPWNTGDIARLVRDAGLAEERGYEY